MTGASHAALTVARSRLAIHRELATTPGRLRLAAALLAIGATVFGVVAVHAADTRRQAVRDVARTEPLLVSAIDLSAALSDAQATAAFGIAGVPDVAAAVQRASADAAQLAAAVTPSAGGPPVRRIVRTLPDYARLIAEARANTREGHPVGLAYLRRSSRRMRETLLPSAQALYAIEAKDLSAHYGAGAARWTVLGVVLTGCVLLALLAGTQVYIARATRRIVNRRLALASALLLALAVWILAAFAMQADRLTSARRTGSEPVQLLQAARNLVSRAQAGESVALAARGGSETAGTRGAGGIAVEDPLEPIGSDRAGSARGSRGLLDRAAAASGRTRAIDEVYAAYRDYLKVRRAPMNVRRARRATEGAAATLDRALHREAEIAQARFDHAVSHADSALRGLAVGIPLVTILCAVFALLGVHQRLREYR